MDHSRSAATLKGSHLAFLRWCSPKPKEVIGLQPREIDPPGG